jgi:hypothetical protein
MGRQTDRYTYNKRERESELGKKEPAWLGSEQRLGHLTRLVGIPSTPQVLRRRVHRCARVSRVHRGYSSHSVLETLPGTLSGSGPCRGAQTSGASSRALWPDSSGRGLGLRGRMKLFPLLS